MKTLFLIGFLFSLGTALISSREASASESKGEVRVYVTDSKGKVPDLAGASGLVYLEPKEGKRETVKLALKTAPLDHEKGGHEAKEHDEEGHGSAMPAGAEVKESGDWRVAVEFRRGEADHKEEMGHEHGEKGEKHEASAIPYFSAAVDFEAYACPMKDAPPSDKPGKCPKCGMKMEEQGREFEAVVVLTLGGKTLNVKGFKYPSSKGFADGVKSIEGAIGEMDKLLAAGQLSKIHPAADRIREIARALPKANGAPKDARVETAAKEMVELFESMDEAADSGKAPETKAIIEKYRKALQTLKAMLPGEEGQGKGHPH